MSPGFSSYVFSEKKTCGIEWKGKRESARLENDNRAKKRDSEDAKAVEEGTA